ncbi:SPASM domain-containing protein, partial [Candidatus Pacearchaeota archaeon]|nr:SPASM domain-containing protein [Candidatus Pacearchaeota archaeon]
EVTSDIIDIAENHSPDSEIENIYQKYGKGAVEEALKELDELRSKRVISSSDNNKFDQPVHPVITTICMNISHTCDLNCHYCYADGGTYYKKDAIMDKNTAEKSIDFLINNSGEEPSLSVSFFGGEPLLNFPVLKHTVEYAKTQGKLHDKKFQFHVTTNGIHLDEKIREFLNEERFSIIVSFDGPKRIHDNQRRYRDGRGSYKTVMANALQILGTRDPYGITIRGTFTGNSHKIGAMMMHPVKLGFRRISVEPCMLPDSHEYAIRLEDVPKIKKAYDAAAKVYLKNLIKGNLFEFFHFFTVMDSVCSPIPQFTQCGAARGYVAVSPTGDIFPCHGLINIDKYKLGTVFNGGVNRDIQKTFHSANVQGKEKCKDCWAKYFCGGGCHAHAIKYGNG